MLFNPAASSALPTLVSQQELIAANGGIWTSAVMSQVVLAPLAGLLYAAFGASPAFAIDAVSFAVSAAVLAGLHLPSAAADSSRRGFFADAVAGVRVLAGDRLLRALAAGQLLAACPLGRPPPCSSCWPGGTSRWPPAVMGCCSARSVSVPAWAHSS